MNIRSYLIEKNFDYNSNKKQALRNAIKAVSFNEDFLDCGEGVIDQDAVNWQLKRADMLGHHIITCFDYLYPDVLKQVYDFPIVLYANGNLVRLKDEKKIAIVGTRKPTYDAKKMCDLSSKQLAKRGHTIVSGLALGTDALAHRGALAYGAPTIAVLASPVDTILPKNNLKLAENILNSEGLILSENPYGYNTHNYMYVGRNRIVSGISHKVFIVEGAEGSGSLTTASHALDQNKPLYAMPGSISNKVAIGTNRLIQQGAYPVISPEDLFDLTYDDAVVLKSSHPILQRIDEYGNLTIDELSKALDISVNVLLSELMILECEEKIEIHENRVYIS